MSLPTTHMLFLFLSIDVSVELVVAKYGIGHIGYMKHDMV